MSTESKTSTYAGVGTAALAERDDVDGYLVHGVALGVNDITVGQSGTKKLWPGEELKEAAATLAGTDLVRDHINNTKGKVGEVTHAEFIEQLGVVYEAEVAPHYEELANDIQAGLMEVSVRAYHRPEAELERDDDTDALIVEDIHFDNLSVVNNGASPSNTANPGAIDNIDADISGTAAASATIEDHGSVATLERSAPVDAVEFDRGDEELSITVEDTPTQGEEFAPDDDAAFETREAAENKAEELGCEVDAHQVTIGTDKYYVPCSSPAAYQQAVVDDDDMDAEENASILEPGMQFYSSINDTMVTIESVTDGTLEVADEDGNVWEEDHDNVLVKLADGDWMNATDDDMETSLIREGMQFFSTINRGMMEIMAVDGDVIEVGVANGESRWNEKKRDILRKLADKEWTLADAAEEADDEYDVTLSVATTEQLASIPGTYSAKGTVYAIAPDEHDDDSTEHADNAKYPLTSCTGEQSVESAWNLRGNGDYSIDESTLEKRIKDAAEAMDCDADVVGMDEFGESEPDGDADELAEDPFSEGDWVSWDSQSSDGEIGRIAGVYEQGDDLPDIRGSNEFDPEEDDVLYTIELFKEEEGTYHPIAGKPVAHYHESVSGTSAPESMSEETIELADSSTEQMAPESDDSDEMVDDTVDDTDAVDEQSSPFAGVVPVATGIASTQSDEPTTTYDFTHMTKIDYEPADADELSEDLDEPVVVEQSELESLAEEAEQAESVDEELGELSEKLEAEESAQDTLDALSEDEIERLESDDDVTVVEASKAEAFDEVSNIYAEELAEYSPFEAEELADKFGPMDLRDKLDAHDEAELSETITETEPEPEGGHANKDELSVDDEDVDEEELRESYAEDLESAGWDRQAEKVRNGEIDLSEINA